MNGCRKLRTRLVKIASDDDQQRPVLKKRKVSPRKIPSISRANSETYLSLRSNGTRAYKEPLTQHENLHEAADSDSIISTSIIFQVPHIIDTIAAPLPSQATVKIEKYHPIPNLSVIVYSTKAACNVTDPSSFERRKLTETSKFNNTSTAKEDILIPIPCSAAISSVIHWIDKGVSALEIPQTKVRPHKLSLIASTAVATTINNSSEQSLRFMIVVRPIQRHHIELPYPQIYDKENWFRPFASIFQMLRINTDSICVKSLQVLENGEKHLKSTTDSFEKEEKSPDPTISCAIEWNKGMDKTLIRCRDKSLNVSPRHNQHLFTTPATDNIGEMDIQNRDADNDCNNSMAALKTQMDATCLKQNIPSSLGMLPNLTLLQPLKKSNIDPSDLKKKYLAICQKNNNNKKLLKIPKITLRDRVQAKCDFIPINSILTDTKRHPKQESLLIKLEVHPNLSNVHPTDNLKNYRKPAVSKNHLNLTSSIEMNKVTNASSYPNK